MNRTEARNIVMTILYQIFMYQANNIDYNKDELIKENLPVDNDFVKLMVNGVLDKKNELFDIANKNLNDTIVATASELGMQDKLHIGMLTTMDVYGPYIDYDRVLNRIPTEYKDKILGEEMEAYALIHIANSMNRSATAMATVADSKFSNVVMSIEDRQESLDDMIVLALESIIK